MSKRDCSKQVEKRQRIKNTTLIVGIDIGNEFNAVALMNKAGEVIGCYPKVYNSRKGFEFFKQTVIKARRQYGLKKALVGMEPTGHYWRKIAFFGKEEGFEVRFVRTTAVKSQRELDESSSAKSDIRDAITIANIVREGKYVDTIIEDGILRQLRTLARVRERIQRYNTGSKHALKAVLDDYFPELKAIFWSMKAKGLWAVLEHYPFPEEVLKAGVDKLIEVIAKSSRRQEEAKQKADKVYKAAQESVGLKTIGIGDRYRVKMYLEEVKRSEAQLKEIELQMKGLLKEVPCAEYILSIRGIGHLSAAVFLGELGNPNNFSRYKQIIKYAGYDPIEHDSGMNIGRRKVSKKGRWLLRKFLYFMGMRVIHRNSYFRKYYDQKLKSTNRYGAPLKKKEALCAVIIKLIKVIFALLRDKRLFTVKAPALVVA